MLMCFDDSLASIASDVIQTAGNTFHGTCLSPYCSVGRYDWRNECSQTDPPVALFSITYCFERLPVYRIRFHTLET